MSAVRILIADDHEFVRKGLIRILGAAHPEWEIAAEVATGEQALAAAIATEPTVAILDLAMPDRNGLEVAKLLLQNRPQMRIVIFTMHSAAPILSKLRRAGIHACLTKSEAPERLVTVIEGVLSGVSFFPEAPGKPDTGPKSGTMPAQFLLTPRELEVMQLLAQGLSNKNIATRLEMSIRTAETHHARILAKLNVESTGELVRVAVRDGLV